MKNALLLLFLLGSISIQSFSQSNRFNISGSVIDTAGIPLDFSSILLLMPEDSALVTYTLSDEDGKFSFKNIPRKNYLIKATYVSYLPHQSLIEPKELDELVLPDILLKPISRELYEVVVKTARAPISIKGDTIEYDASKFKVPPGSTVEDLLRKLPGVEVLQDGSISAQGENVQKITVDGKRFFGGDTKMATKNLDANIIKKVQIFDDKSEQSKLTGIDDGNTEKTVNLELKEEAKKGGFGKIIAGTGTDSRTAVSANYNKFDSKNQFSMVGFGNNTNQTGMSWDDYQDFRGSNSFRWGNDGNFGFRGNNNYNSNSGDENFSLPRSNGPGEGFSNNLAAGINYNYNHKEDEISANYFYNQRDQTLDAFQEKQSFFSNTLSNLSTDQSSQINFNGNHRMSLRGQKELDSLNTITFIGNARLNNSESLYSSAQEIFRDNGFNSNISNIANSTDRLSYATSSVLIFRHKFIKKGRNFAVSGSHDLSNNDTENIQESVNEFYEAIGVNDFIRSINQLNNTIGKSNELKSSLLYIEPFAKHFSWETFYNFSVNTSEVDREVTDKFPDKPQERNRNLSRLFDNQIRYNRIGTSVRYSFKGLNITSGIARAFYNIDGELSAAFINSGVNAFNKKYAAWTPYSAISYSMKNNKRLHLDYSMGLSPPSMNDLQPIVDNSNPLYIREGNPDLLPEVSHSVSGQFSTYNPVSFIHLYIGSNYSYNINQVVYNQDIDPELFIITTRPTNITGGNNFNTYSGFGFPLKKTKATMNLNLSIGQSKYLSLINGIQNETRSNNYRLGSSLNLTPVEWFTFYGSTSWSLGNTAYSINTRQNAKIRSDNYSGEMNIKFPKSFFWSTNLNYRIYKNESFGFDQKIPILNMSAYKLLGKNKKMEVRVSAYDLFKKNLGINQSASQNFISTREVQTLSRYFMLSFTFNMRGVSEKITKW